jgi:hypothetical protein
VAMERSSGVDLEAFKEGGGDHRPGEGMGGGWPSQAP